MNPLLSLLLLPLYLIHAEAAPGVTIGDTTVVGKSVQNQEFFGGIPYAKPPTGALRFSPPVPLASLGKKTFDATHFGKGCLQAGVSTEQTSEDCLTINILRPTGVHETSKLPVLFWTYGGGFVTGNSTGSGSAIVARSVQRGTPVIYVSFNYRLGPLGFPQGQEASRIGVLNLGLKDEVAALQWVQTYIEIFGGDKTKVTVFGESAGAIMTAILMLDRGFTSLARAAILESGSAASIPELRGADKQTDWEGFTEAVPSCRSIASSNATLDCLRAANTKEITTAFADVMGSPSLLLGFSPSLDGLGGFLPVLPSNTLASGNFAKIPFIAGTNLDEGTAFTPTNTAFNDALIRFLFREIVRPMIDEATSNATIHELLQLYPENPALGSPFGTGNETFGQPVGYKRLAAILGDISFESQRRALSQAASVAGVNVWSYLFTQPTPKVPPYLGVPHASELPYVFGYPSDQSPSSLALSTAIIDYWVSFATSLDPNDGKGSKRTKWPRYTQQSQVLLQLHANDTKVINDTYRQKQISFINSNNPSFRHRRSLAGV